MKNLVSKWKLWSQKKLQVSNETQGSEDKTFKFAIKICNLNETRNISVVVALGVSDLLQ